MEAGLALGSNIEDRLEHLVKAGKLLLMIPGVSFEARAPVYETEPVDVPAQFAGSAFLNSVMIVKTRLPVHELAGPLRRIETEMGRTTAPRNSPRIIDIDIIYADQVRVENDELTVPHPLWSRRRFVLQPLSDVRPNLRIDGCAGTVSDVLRGLNDKHKVELFTKEW